MAWQGKKKKAQILWVEDEMREQIAKKIVGIMLASTALLVLFGVAFHVCVAREMNLVTTYVASRDIPPRTKIRASDLKEIHVPYAYLQEYTYVTKEEIIGKYTEIQGKIPAGSAFYQGMLYEETTIPDFPSAQLKQGQSAYTLEVDLASLGGNVVPGQRVDIYASFKQREEHPLTGCLFENVRVIAIKDRKGFDITEEESSKTPYLVILAIRQKDIAYLTLAEELGTLRLFTSSHTYDTDKEACFIEDSLVGAYVLQEKIEKS